jgi:hypothetical protein
VRPPRPGADFEADAGRKTSKKWKKSLRVVDSAGNVGPTLERWGQLEKIAWPLALRSSACEGAPPPGAPSPSSKRTAAAAALGDGAPPPRAAPEPAAAPDALLEFNEYARAGREVESDIVAAALALRVPSVTEAAARAAFGALLAQHNLRDPASVEALKVNAMKKVLREASP